VFAPSVRIDALLYCGILRRITITSHGDDAVTRYTFDDLVATPRRTTSLS
jgi:hypothetical protein